MANTQINIDANGTKTLATAGKYCDRNVDVNVNVPVPEGYIKPSGTKSITTNGTHDVTSYASADVNVPIPSDYIKPTGTKSITANGEHDVASYAKANVNVPIPSGYIKPSGSKTITENGTHDVTSFASAIVNVPIPVGGIRGEKHEITIASNITGSGNVTTLLTNNAFIKENYAKNGFYVVMRAKTDNAKIAYGMLIVVHGNRQLASGIGSSHGVVNMLNSGATATALSGVNGAINGSTWNLGFRVTSAGALNLYTPANRNVAAGTYEIYLICEE